MQDIVTTGLLRALLIKDGSHSRPLNVKIMLPLIEAVLCFSGKMKRERN
jgi:hypothetical protein